METIFLSIAPKASADTAARVRAYRTLWRIALVIMAVQSFVIGSLIAHITTVPPETVIVTRTETAAPVAVAETAEPVAEPAPTDPPAFYALTAEQRTLIEEVVSAEARGESYEGQVAVAQCILNACLKHDITPERAISKYKYTTNRAKPTKSVKKAVAAVFDRGEGVTEEPILYFYAPDLVTSDFHESQDFVIEIGCHRFFKAAE